MRTIPWTPTRLLFVLLGLLAPAGLWAQSEMELRANFRILNFEEGVAYGPLVSKLVATFEKEVGNDLAHEGLEIQQKGPIIGLNLRLTGDLASDLKSRLKATVLQITSVSMKDALSLEALELHAKRRHLRSERQRGRRKVVKKKEGKGKGAPDRTEMARLNINVGDGGIKKSEIFDQPLHKVVRILSTLRGMNFVLRPEIVFVPVNLTLHDVSIEVFLEALEESARVRIEKRDAYYLISKDQGESSTQSTK